MKDNNIMKKPSGIIPFYAQLNPNLMPAIKEEKAEPTVYEKLYKVINKKKSLVDKYQNKIRRIMSGPFREVDGVIDDGSMKSYKTHSSYTGSVRSFRSSSSRGSVDSFRSYQCSLVSSLKSARSRRSSHSASSCRKNGKSSKKHSIENPLNEENIFEKATFLLSAIVNKDYATINENLKHIKKNVRKTSKSTMFSIFLVLFMIYFYRNQKFSATNNVSKIYHTTTSSSPELTDIKNIILNSGTAFKLSEETLSKIQNLPMKTPHLKIPKQSDVATYSVSMPKFDSAFSESATVTENQPNTQISSQQEESISFLDMLTNSLE